MIKIRRVNSEDIPQLEHLFLEVRRSTFSWEDPNKFKLNDYIQATLGETIFVAEDNDQLIGFISVWEHESPAFIHHLYVTKSYQRQGIGLLLIQSTFSHIALPYQLKCVIRNRNALSFYLKNGWTVVEKGLSEEGEYLLLELPELYCGQCAALRNI